LCTHALSENTALPIFVKDVIFKAKVPSQERQKHYKLGVLRRHVHIVCVVKHCPTHVSCIQFR